MILISAGGRDPNRRDFAFGAVVRYKPTFHAHCLGCTSNAGGEWSTTITHRVQLTGFPRHVRRCRCARCSRCRRNPASDLLAPGGRPNRDAPRCGRSARAWSPRLVRSDAPRRRWDADPELPHTIKIAPGLSIAGPREGFFAQPPGGVVHLRSGLLRASLSVPTRLNPASSRGGSHSVAGDDASEGAGRVP